MRLFLQCFYQLVEFIWSGEYTNNVFQLNEWLEKRYETLMRKYTRQSIFPNITDISNPFWHLESDGFWHLHYLGEELSKTHTPSKKWLKENVRYASFDDDLWMLLQNQVMRQLFIPYFLSQIFVAAAMQISDAILYEGGSIGDSGNDETRI